MKMAFTAMLVDALHSTLQDAEIAFNRIRMDFAAVVFAPIVVHYAMLCEFTTNQRVIGRLIRHENSFLGKVFAHDGAGVLAFRSFTTMLRALPELRSTKVKTLNLW